MRDVDRIRAGPMLRRVKTSPSRALLRLSISLGAHRQPA